MEEGIHHPGNDADSLSVENAIFEAALQLDDPAQRRAFLDRTFDGDLQGRKGMEDLLEMTEIASTYFTEGRLRIAELAREVLAEFPGLGPE
jgi:hypothetical protein